MLAKNIFYMKTWQKQLRHLPLITYKASNFSCIYEYQYLQTLVAAVNMAYDNISLDFTLMMNAFRFILKDVTRYDNY